MLICLSNLNPYQKYAKEQVELVEKETQSLWQYVSYMAGIGALWYW